jgi:uncharacterized membrane protein
MSLFMQVFPFVLMLVYVVLTIFLILLAVRFVAAHERIAKALEDAARHLRRE